MNLSSNMRAVKSVITANSPVLLVGTAIAGVISTGVLAAMGGYKARGIIDEATAEKGEPLELQEQVKLTWLCYAAPALTGASTILSVVGVHTIHNKRHAALAGLYAVTSNRLDEYTEKAEELLGPKKTQQLNNEIAQKHVDDSTVPDSHEIVITGRGNELCYDDWSGRYFLGSWPLIEEAVHRANIRLVEDGDVSLNDLYDYMGLSPIPIGSEFGWSGEKIEPKVGSVIAPDGRSAISVWFQESPKPNMGRK